MNFGDILNQWDSQQKSGKPASSPGRKQRMAKWLDAYPPENGKEHNADSMHRTMEFAKNRKEMRRLRPQRCIDLHGATVSGALTLLDGFLKEAESMGLKKVLIIHGKGNHSGSRSVLREAVKRYLQDHPTAGEIGAAERADGGSGATWVLIRHRSR